MVHDQITIRIKVIVMEDIFRGVGVEITLPKPDNFLKIKETLTRVGIASRKERKLYQSCHILHKQGRYVILHFKELFILDGKDNNFTDEDKARDSINRPFTKNMIAGINRADKTMG